MPASPPGRGMGRRIGSRRKPLPQAAPRWRRRRLEPTIAAFAGQRPEARRGAAPDQLEATASGAVGEKRVWPRVAVSSPTPITVT